MDDKQQCDSFDAWWAGRGLGVGTGKKAAWHAYLEGRRAAIEADRKRGGEPVDIRQEVIETLEMILAADWRKWEELASPDEFVRWAKSRANYALSIINEAPQPAEPVKVPSGAVEALQWMRAEYDPANGEMSALKAAALDAAIAALQRHGQPAQPAASAEPVVTDAMHAHFEGIYNGLDLAERTEIIEGILRLAAPVAAQPEPVEVPSAKFTPGDHVRKTKGSRWQGIVAGTYSTSLTPEGYAVESDTETGSVQIYPAAALELVGSQA